MNDLPPQIDRRVRKELKKLRKPWEVVKKRDHYFVKIGTGALICIANNSSRSTDYQTMKTLDRIRKA